MWVVRIVYVLQGNLLNTMPITEEIFVEFLTEHQINTAAELEEFSQNIHLLMMEPNIPLAVIN
jgi:beta-phosphoglucomutase-like phosphatase (HAD superfamily)